jgi:hypothetical protein
MTNLMCSRLVLAYQNGLGAAPVHRPCSRSHGMVDAIGSLLRDATGKGVGWRLQMRFTPG